MAKGVVKWFNATKGFGFIAPEGGGKDVFVHIGAVKNSGLRPLIPGDQVDFQIEEGPGGDPSAVNLSFGGTHGSGGGPDD